MNSWACIYDGDFCSGYTCMTCVEIINASEEEGGIPGGFVFEMLSKGETPEDMLQRCKNIVNQIITTNN